MVSPAIMRYVHAPRSLCLPSSPAPLAAPAASAQQTAQPPRRRSASRSNYVEVDAFVTDAQGNAVTDLTRRRLRAARGRQAAEGVRRSRWSTSRSSAPSGRCSRPRPIEADVQTNDRHRGPHLSVRARRPAHRLHPHAARQGGRCAGSSSRTSAPTTWPPSSSPAAGRRTRRTSPTTRGCCCAAIDKFIGRKLRSATLERLDEYDRRQTAGDGQRRDPVDDIDGMRARLQRAQRDDSRCRSWRSSWPACTAGARRCCWSARASTTTSTKRVRQQLDRVDRHATTRTTRSPRPRAATSASTRSIRAG